MSRKLRENENTDSLRRRKNANSGRKLSEFWRNKKSNDSTRNCNLKPHFQTKPLTFQKSNTRRTNSPYGRRKRKCGIFIKRLRNQQSCKKSANKNTWTDKSRTKNAAGRKKKKNTNDKSAN